MPITATFRATPPALPPSPVAAFLKSKPSPDYEDYKTWCVQNNYTPADQRAFDSIFYPNVASEPSTIAQAIAQRKRQFITRRR